MSQTDFLEYVINSIQFVFKNNQIYRGSGWILADINGCKFCLPIDARRKLQRRIPCAGRFLARKKRCRKNRQRFLFLCKQ
jgi:hypothetical protein